MLRIALIVVVTPVVFLLACQSRMIYFPRSYDAEDLAGWERAGFERLAYQTKWGKQTAYYVPPRVGNVDKAELWLCFSGNGGLALEWMDVIDQWDPRFAYLLIDYPSYGECQGRPGPRSIREGGAAAYQALAAHLGSDPAMLKEQSRVLGHSLGAAAALMVADDLDLRSGVLVSPFTSMTEMGRNVLGWPLCHLNLHRFDNRKTLGEVLTRKAARFEIFHGDSDEVIPFRMGRELAAAHPEKVGFHEVKGSGHNDILFLANRQIGDAMRELAGHLPGAMAP